MSSQVNQEEFKKDAKDGMSINALAKKYGIQWMAAKNLAQELAEAEAQEPEPGLEPGQEEEGEPATYDIATTVPTHRLNDLLRCLSSEELAEALELLTSQVKADILQAVLQKKMDRLLEPKQLDTAKLELIELSATR